MINDKIILPTFNVVYIALYLITAFLLYVKFLKRAINSSNVVRIQKTTLI